MKQLQDFGDERNGAFCIYCGGRPETREHTPSRIFLDEPFPENLPIVRSCGECNNKFSGDEEYLACLIECARVGSTLPNLIGRDKVRHALANSPNLASRIEAARTEKRGRIRFSIEKERISRVLMKLARGHIRFEQSEPPSSFDDPESFSFGTIDTMTEEQRTRFETPPSINIFPEVGSRALQRIAIDSDSLQFPWIEVQPGRYRYLSLVPRGVRIVFSEYFWCEVRWE